MSRWRPDARSRLEDAAMRLYAERGFDQTTVAEIAEQAGLTERTFFRHFADKREVLFGGAEMMKELLVRTVSDAPETAAPLVAVTLGLDAIGALLQDRRAYARQRQRIISATPELQERELIKMATLAGALVDVLRERGVSDPTSSLVAEVAIAVFRAAFDHWVEAADDEQLSSVIRSSFEALSLLATDGAPAT